MRVLVVFGTRPEAIKMCPLVKELKRHPNELDVVVCVTGQHREMLDQVLRVFDVVPDVDLAVMKRVDGLNSLTVAILEGLDGVLEDVKPDIVLVHGDTTSAMAAALASFYRRIPVGHVEAGLRTGNLESPFPEEFNRQCIDLVSRWYFAPTSTSRDNLIAEGKDPSSIFVTGNTAIDALKTTVTTDYRSEITDWVDGSRLVLLTAHRRENLDRLRSMFGAIRTIADRYPDVKVVYPVHLNPDVQLAAEEVLHHHSRIRMIEPLDTLAFHNLLSRAFMVLTDSGGIQEEAPSLGVPVLVMRDTTERPEGVQAGTLRLVGTEPETIVKAASRLLEDEDERSRMAAVANPYGDGEASQRIASILLREAF